MNKFLSLLILLSAALTTKAQLPVPVAPGTCTSPNCITNSNIDVCPAGSNTVVSVHQNGVYNRGNNTNHLADGAIWRFRNMATVSGTTVNVEVTVDQAYNSTLVSIDDDAATDQSGASMTTYFSPRISSNTNLTTGGGDRRGYVQFTMKFYKNSTGVNNNSDADFAVPVNLSNINYVHYDIDGFDAGTDVGANGSWMRETGLAKRVSATNPVVNANATTELKAYNYTDAGADWTGFAGSVCEKDGISKCAQVAAAFRYNGAFPSITFRMGYDYNRGGNVGRPIRQYGSRLGCFNFPQQAVLPIQLVSFNAIYKNGITQLKWTAQNEVNFQKFVIERSTDGRNFTDVAEKNSYDNGATSYYELNDDITNASGINFYYRLRMVDFDTKFSYSSVIMVRKENKTINGIVMNPNPVRNGLTTVRFTASHASVAEIRVVDIAGKTVLRQQTSVYEGANSISINQLEKLLPGIYNIQMINDGEISVIKFSVIR